MYDWLKYPMRLQYLEANDGAAGGAGGSGGAGGADGSGGAGSEGGAGGAGSGAGAGGAGGAGGQAPTLADVLKDPAQQAEFDRRVTKALETAKAKWDADSKLTAEERAAQATKEKEEALAAKEKDLNQRELKTKAQGILAEKKLPTRLANRLDYTSEEAMQASLKEVEADFTAALQEAVKEKLKGNPPPAGGAGADPDENKRRAAMGLPPIK